jgi:hypothetical protein
MRRYPLMVVVALAIVVASAWYLYDPPWIAETTTGIRPWETDPAGRRFRWTTGHASFYVPSNASAMTLPMRAWFPSKAGGPVIVSVRIDDRRVADLELRNPDEWVSSTVPLPRRPTHRRYRRVDLRLSRTVGQRNLGVAIGAVQCR